MLFMQLRGLCNQWDNSDAKYQEDTELIQLVSVGDAVSLQALHSQNFRLKTFFHGWVTDDAMEEGMRHLFYRFSDEAVYSRYFHSISSMTQDKIHEYVNEDWNQVVSIVGLVGEEGKGRIIAETRYIKIPISSYV